MIAESFGKLLIVEEGSAFCSGISILSKQVQISLPLILDVFSLLSSIFRPSSFQFSIVWVRWTQVYEPCNGVRKSMPSDATHFHRADIILAIFVILSDE